MFDKIVNILLVLAMVIGIFLVISSQVHAVELSINTDIDKDAFILAFDAADTIKIQAIYSLYERTEYNHDLNSEYRYKAESRGIGIINLNNELIYTGIRIIKKSITLEYSDTHKNRSGIAINPLIGIRYALTDYLLVSAEYGFYIDNLEGKNTDTTEKRTESNIYLTFSF